jgi:Protein of unknown function (DUF3592)
VTNLDQAATWILNRRRKILRYNWVPSAIFGVLLLGAGYLFGKGPLHLILEGQRTTGTIVDYREGRDVDSEGKTGFWPIVEFQVNNRPVRFKHWLGGNAPGRTGEPVNVLYEAANPSNAMIDRPLLKWMPWSPLAALGLLLTLSALKGWRATRRT